MRRRSAAAAALLLAIAAAAPAAGAAQAGPDAGIVVDRAFMAGRWTDTGDCGDAATLNRDGRFVAANGGQGLWHVDGGRLTMSGASTLIMRVTPVDRDTVTVVNPDGSVGRSTRCGDAGAAGGGTPPAAPAPDRRYVTGRWSDDGDCSKAARFARDGRFVTHDGNSGRWRLAGDRLTLTGGRTLVLRIVPIDRDAMIVVNPDGSLGRSTRC